MEDLMPEERLLIAWAIGYIRSKLDDYDGITADSILKKLRTK